MAAEVAMANKRSNAQFQGYTSPSYTPVPDELFDVQLPDLSGAELKVLLYVIRRTFGFKRESDNISLSQMLNGLRTHDGRQLDRGVGLSKKTLLLAIKSLEEKNIVLTERRRSAEKGDEPTTYQLNVRSRSAQEESTPPVGEKVHHGVGEKLLQGGGGETSPGPWGKNYATQQTGDRQTDRHNSNIRRSSHEKENETTEQPEPVFRHATPERSETSGTSSARRRSGEPVKTVPLGEAIADWQRRRQVQPTVPAPAPPTSGASDQVDAGAPQRRGRRAKPVYDEDREVLLAFITDFAREFNDQAPLSSSVTRAYNLLKRSELDRNGFLDRMYQARALTKERTGSIRSRAGENDFGLPVKAKMAFFFAVLEDLVGLRDDEASPPEPQ